MKDTLLKKSFGENDLKRIRNLIQGNTNASSKSIFGYEKNNIYRNNEEIFEENGKKWIIIDGIKKSYSKLNSLKISLKSPLLCPECHKPMGKYDSQMFKIHQKCLDCVATQESLLKINGSYDEYKNNIFHNNIEFFINEAIEYVKDEINSNDMFVTEEGDIENWEGGDTFRKKFLNETLKELEEFKSSQNI